MNSRSFGEGMRPFTPLSAEAPDEYRTRILTQQADAAERRRQDLKDQSSTLKTPGARIRIWERVHDTRLPRDQAHVLVPVIAAGTGLTAEEVQEAQRERFRPPADAAASPK